jgi:hypothetical protein
MCDVASHAKSKAVLKRGSLYPHVPKKGLNQVQLEPSLSLSLMPADKTVDRLLLEEKSIALWRTYMDACKASELRTGRNEFGMFAGEEDTPDVNEHRLLAPSLQELADADAFKTPKKVRVIAALEREVDEDYVEITEIGSVSALNIDLTGMSPLEGTKRTAGNLAMRRVLSEWDSLAACFRVLKSRFLDHEALTGKTRDDVVLQFHECNHCMNELGNKARLLSARVGRDERPDQAETSVWEALNMLRD